MPPVEQGSASQDSSDTDRSPSGLLQTLEVVTESARSQLKVPPWSESPIDLTQARGKVSFLLNTLNSPELQKFNGYLAGASDASVASRLRQIADGQIDDPVQVDSTLETLQHIVRAFKLSGAASSANGTQTTGGSPRPLNETEEHAYLSKVSERFYGGWQFKGLALVLTAAVLMAVAGDFKLGDTAVKLLGQLSETEKRGETELGKSIEKGQAQLADTLTKMTVADRDFRTRVEGLTTKVDGAQTDFTNKLNAATQEVMKQRTEDFSNAANDKIRKFSSQVDDISNSKLEPVNTTVDDLAKRSKVLNDKLTTDQINVETLESFGSNAEKLASFLRDISKQKDELTSAAADAGKYADMAKQGEQGVDAILPDLKRKAADVDRNLQQLAVSTAAMANGATALGEQETQAAESAKTTDTELAANATAADAEKSRLEKSSSTSGRLENEIVAQQNRLAEASTALDALKAGEANVYKPLHGIDVSVEKDAGVEGNVASRLEKLQSELNSVEPKFEPWKGQMEARLKDLQARLDSLSASVAGRETELADLETREKNAEERSRDLGQRDDALVKNASEKEGLFGALADRTNRIEDSAHTVETLVTADVKAEQTGRSDLDTLHANLTDLKARIGSEENRLEGELAEFASRLKTLSDKAAGLGQSLDDLGKRPAPNVTSGNASSGGADATRTDPRDEAHLTSADWSAIQAKLKAQPSCGCDPGAIDGDPGRGTRAAVRKFQLMRNEKSTGRLTPEEITFLLGA
jgi:chromosome segregation ATPase